MRARAAPAPGGGGLKIRLPLALLLALAACDGKPAVPLGKGTLLVDAPAREVIGAPVGTALAYLEEPKQAKELGIKHVSDATYVGTAAFVPDGGGTRVVLGTGTATGNGSVIFAPTGRWVAALVQFDFKEQTGTLVLGDTKTGTTRVVAEQAGYFAFTNDGRWLGYVAKDRLRLEPPDASAPPQEVVEGAGTFEFSRDGSRFLVRRKLISDGALLLGSLPAPGTPIAPPVELQKAVADYAFSPDGKLVAFTARGDGMGYDLFVRADGAKPTRLGTGVTGFLFSPDGRTLAFHANVTPNKQYGDLFVLLEGRAEAVKLGESAAQPGFSRDGTHLAWLDKYDPQSRSGTLTWTKLTEPPTPKKAGTAAQNFLWSRTGAYLGFVSRQTKPIFSIDLFVETIGGTEPAAKVAVGVFGYEFGPKDETLYFRGHCVRNGRACNLLTVKPGGPYDAPKTIAQGVYTFEWDPTETKFMLTWARMDMDAYDVGVLPADGSRPAVTLDEAAAPGTRWVGAEGKAIGYALLRRGRSGVFLADVDAALAEPVPPPP